jgi:anti-sigma factor RsiW
MNCTHLEELINDYVDGQLSEDEWHDVEQHLKGCAACRRSLEQLRGLVDQAAALPKEIPPSRDLLPGIRRVVEAAGAPQARGAWMWWASLAASVLVVITVGITTMTFNDRGGEAAQVAPAPGAILSASHNVVSAFHAAEQEYLRAAALLTEVLDKRRGTLTPETAALVDENLEIINQAIANVRLALNADPANPRNGQVLTALYQQKIEILRRVSRLSS